jgi:hypothetical protein
MQIELTGHKHPWLSHRVYPEIGERVPVRGCFSEVQMHIGTAGRDIEVALVPDTYISGKPVPLDKGGPMCQVYVGGRPCSAPILPCEGGFYRDEDNRLYTYGDPARLPVVAKPRRQPALADYTDELYDA